MVAEGGRASRTTRKDREQLKKELTSYEEGKPVREIQTQEEPSSAPGEKHHTYAPPSGSTGPARTLTSDLPLSPESRLLLYVSHPRQKIRFELLEVAAEDFRNRPSALAG